MLVSVVVKRLARDPRSDTLAVVLGPPTEEREFHVRIGPAEAAAIAVQLAGKEVPRPLTHDLMVSVIAGFGGRLTRVAIDRVDKDTIYARLYLERDGQTLTLDARPSDSLAAALRAGAEMVINDALLGPPAPELEAWGEDPMGTKRLVLEGMERPEGPRLATEPPAGEDEAEDGPR